jgi:methylated-DNA-[protein]-cysteine S-methyltransferase
MKIKAYCSKNNKAKKIYFENEFQNINPQKLKEKNIKECPELEKLIINYLNGKNINFNKYLDINDLDNTKFEKQVYSATLKIPKGQVKTYKEIGQNINSKAYRAIGNALNKNPIPIIIPCHRVIGSNKTLTGFKSGLKIKKELLQKEGVKIENNKVIS